MDGVVNTDAHLEKLTMLLTTMMLADHWQVQMEECSIVIDIKAQGGYTKLLTVPIEVLTLLFLKEIRFVMVPQEAGVVCIYAHLEENTQLLMVTPHVDA